MTTQKKAIEDFKATQGLIYVYSFENDIRYSTYGNLDIIQAYKEIEYHLAYNRRIVLTDENGYNEILSYELRNNERVPLKVAQTYSKVFLSKKY